jgi:hypothetical protein
VTRQPAIRRTIAVELSSAMWASAASRLPPFLLHPLPFVCSATFLAAKIAVEYRPPVVSDEQLATSCPDTNPPSRHGSRGQCRRSVFKDRCCHRQWGIMHHCLPYSVRPAASKIERKSLGTIERALEHPWNKTLSLWGDFQQLPGRKAIESSGVMERAMGIEPTSRAWEAPILPLNYARTVLYANKPA